MAIFISLSLRIFPIVPSHSLCSFSKSRVCIHEGFLNLVFKCYYMSVHAVHLNVRVESVEKRRHKENLFKKMFFNFKQSI